MKKISIVIPAYNEQENIESVYRELIISSGEWADYDFEMIFVDDCSMDDSYHLMQQLAEKDNRVKIVKLSRNFGYQRAIFTGYSMASGDAAVQIDCDLQDPPALIKDFIKKWEQGYEVVYGIRQSRQESRMMSFGRKLFYRALDLLSTEKLPLDAGDFRLIDRKVLNELIKMQDHNLYIRGSVAFLGFKQTGIPYDRPARLRGKSKFGIIKLMGMATDAVLNHSIVPLRLATFTGIFLAFIALIALVVAIFAKIVFGQNWPSGFATTTILILASIMLNALFLGIIGEYLGRIYQQTKNRPVAVIDKLTNF